MGGNDATVLRLHHLALLACFCAASLPAKEAATAPSPLPEAGDLAQRIAARYGADDFHRIKSLHYVFHVKLPGKKIEREWTWFPKEDSVLYKGEDPKGVKLTAAYSRKNTFSMGSESVAAIDKSFVNDQYWLLFPLHLKWDKDLTLKVSPGEKAGEAYHLMVMYPSTGGYTPGDAYDLFVDSSATLKRWVFRKGNSPEPTVEAKWSKPVKVEPLDLSLEHPGPDEKKFKLWFSDVKAESDPS
ncbi:MAG: hypothetical protein JWP91_3958 [Fibrobacteres bacterium]|nr:hypothetical protein [Fibrobacterota bacterium]